MIPNDTGGGICGPDAEAIRGSEEETLMGSLVSTWFFICATQPLPGRPRRFHRPGSQEAPLRKGQGSGEEGKAARPFHSPTNTRRRDSAPPPPHPTITLDITYKVIQQPLSNDGHLCVLGELRMLLRVVAPAEK